MRAHDPATAQGAGRPIEVRLSKGEAVHDAFRFRFNVPIVVLVVIAAGQLEHGLITDRRIFLRQEANAGRLLERNLAVIRRRLAEDEREERRLARAVRTDEAHAIATIYLKRRIFKKRATAERFCDL